MHLWVRISAVAAVSISSLGVVGAVSANGQGSDNGRDAATEYWTPQRVASAQPRDLVIDERGLGYLRGADGSLEPHGHTVAATVRPLKATPVAGQQQVTAPSPAAAELISMDPAADDTIGTSHSFSAEISGAKQVTAYVGRSGGSYQSFRMTNVGGANWQANLQGFSTGEWNWYVSVRDDGPRGGSTVTLPGSPVQFSVGGSGAGGTIVDQRWTAGGQVQQSAGRILFTMSGVDYVCSGTAITDGTTGRSIILTAAHCIYDDVAKAFASNAIFIPSQDDGGTDRTDSNCDNDPFGCWTADHGVVDVNWTTRTFPDNIPWDYGYYVVSDSGAHSGTALPSDSSSDALDAAVGTLDVSFTAPTTGTTATALGYSYAQDPQFRYCQETMITNGSSNYWLDSCDLTGGSSGGPWMQPLEGGNGTIMSVNSWGYTTRAGMAGPKLHDNSAALLFEVSTCSVLDPTANGYVVDPASNPSCDTTTTTAAPTTTQAPGAATLTVDAYKDKGEKIGVLSWTGLDGDSVDIFRDGTLIHESSSNDGTAEDRTGEKGGGVTTWKVCGADTSTCVSVTHTW